MADDEEEGWPGPAKAYENPRFMNSPGARALRILAEYVEPRDRFNRHQIEDTVVFFGSARLVSKEEAEAEIAAAKGKGEELEALAQTKLRNSRYYEATRELAYRLTEWSKGLGGDHKRFVVCSGGGPGIMEAANRGASEARGMNVGLNISLPFEQIDNPYITRELNFEFHYFFMRKFWFMYLAKAMVIMPGGFGTLDELFEVLTLQQTGKIRKPMPVILFGEDYWSKVVNFKALVEFGTISPEDLDLFLLTDSTDEAFDYLSEQLLKHALPQPGASL
ncbi:MAG: TIGR00730 family Rossman fold protein [Rhodovibrionaceae bacterium]